MPNTGRTGTGKKKARPSLSEILASRRVINHLCISRGRKWATSVSSKVPPRKTGSRNMYRYFAGRASEKVREGGTTHVGRCASGAVEDGLREGAFGV